MALFDAVQRRAVLLDFKQPLQPPRRGYPACMIGAPLLSPALNPSFGTGTSFKNMLSLFSTRTLILCQK